MNEKSILYGVIGVLVFAFIANIISGRLKAIVSGWMQRRKDETAAQLRLAEAMEKWAVQVELMPKYMAGFVSVCEAQVKQYEDLTKAIGGFTGAVLGPRKDDGFTEYNEEAANRSWIKQSFMAEGKTEEEANALADQEEKKRVLSFPQE